MEGKGTGKRPEKGGRGKVHHWPLRWSMDQRRRGVVWAKREGHGGSMSAREVMSWHDMRLVIRLSKYG